MAKATYVSERIKPSSVASVQRLRGTRTLPHSWITTRSSICIKMRLSCMRVAKGWKSSTGVLPFTGDGSERARNGIYPYRSPLRYRYHKSMSSHRMIWVVDLIGPIDLTDIFAPNLSDEIQAQAKQIVRISSKSAIALSAIPA